MNLNQAIDEFLMYLDVEKNYSDNTIAGYALDLRSLSQCLNQNKRELTLETLSPATIRRYIRDQVVTYGIKPRTLHRRISCLKSFSHFCLKENWITVDFTAGVESPKTEKHLPTYMSLKELQQLFRYLEQSTERMSKRNHLLFKLLGTSGMRR